MKAHFIMQEQQIISLYQRVAHLTRQMLAAAGGGHWERLISLEQECRSVIANLMEQECPPHSGAEFQRRKAELIRAALQDDADIRLLVEPRLKNLSGLLTSGRQQQRLQSIYCGE